MNVEVKIEKVEIILTNHGDPCRIARHVAEQLKAFSAQSRTGYVPRWLLPADPTRTTENVRR